MHLCTTFVRGGQQRFIRKSKFKRQLIGGNHSPATSSAMPSTNSTRAAVFACQLLVYNQLTTGSQEVTGSIFAMKRITPFGLLLACSLLIVSCRQSPQSYVARGNKFYETGKYDDAILNYKKAIQRD